RNPTPLRDYGKGADDYDLRIKPQGGRSPSTGVVSPLYDKPNYGAGVSIHDRGGKISSGKVADLYNNNPSKSLSTGGVSELFRIRKPRTDADLNNQ
ncbi:MAG: hypothetical protein LBK06_09420, partial [Planctomycetaceae bacterium]|nr:hypothetical protein [Planctomycetaceae bacterium]